MRNRDFRKLSLIQRVYIYYITKLRLTSYYIFKTIWGNISQISLLVIAYERLTCFLCKVSQVSTNSLLLSYAYLTGNRQQDSKVIFLALHVLRLCHLCGHLCQNAETVEVFKKLKPCGHNIRLPFNISEN